MKKAILIADDVELNRAILAMTFDGEYDILQAENGVQVVEQLQQHSSQIQAVLLDLVMPKMDGFHFSSKVKENPVFKSIPLIFNSSLSNEFMSEKGIQESGGEGYLVKFNANEFYSEIIRIIKEHEQR